MNENAEKETSKMDVSTLITNLLSNPETISKIGNIISNIGEATNEESSPLQYKNINNDDAFSTHQDRNTPNVNNLSPTSKNIDTSAILSKIPEILSNFSSEKPENSLANKQQIALLLAIRPYLSEHRQELIDTFIKMNRLGAIFKNLT